MNSIITPIVLIILSVGLFFTVTDAQYTKVKGLNETNQAYVKAINNSNDLLKRRDKLLDDFNSFPAKDSQRLEKIVPDNIDNVRLIIDINGITSKYGVSVQNVNVGTARSGGAKATDAKTGIQKTPAAGAATPTPTTPTPATGVAASSVDTKTYQSATLSFSVSTTYDNFIKILHDIEHNLRILDVTSVTFDAGSGEPYKYNVTVQAYWMK